MEQRGGRKGGFGGNKGAGSRGPRREGGAARPYKPRGESAGYERKPRESGERSYAPRGPRAEGDRPARPYAKREGSGYARKPREGGYERKPREDGDRPARPYAKREGGERSYAPRAEGDRPARPYAKREGGFERKPRGEFSEKREYKPRGDKPAFERAPRENRGEGKPARFDGKREVRRDYRRAGSTETAVRGDGWLVGHHAVMAALAAGRRKVRKIWVLAEPKGELATLIEQHPEWPVELKAKPDFESEFGELVHQGVAVLVGNLPQPSLPELLSSKPKLLVALDQVTDPHNLGAIMRSCAAFGAEGVLVTEHRAAGLNATVAKAAAGAMEVVPVAEVTNLAQSIEMMKEAGFTVVGMAGEAEAEIGELSVDGPLCLVVGSEGEGLRRLTREHCDRLVKIRIAPAMESLNVSVATGVALALLARK